MNSPHERDEEEMAVAEALRKLKLYQRPFRLVWWRLLLSLVIAGFLALLILITRPGWVLTIAIALSSFFQAILIRPWRND